MLAHELRNPLAPIRNAGALLARLDTSDPTLALIRQVIQRQVEHMTRLLDDLLDASHVTSGKVNLQRRPTAVSAFVDQAVEIYGGLIETQHQQLTLDMPVTPIYVDGDPVRLAQIIGNLLHNAAKYTQEGGVIAVSARPAGNTVVIRVSDNGSGISADAVLHIFDLFSQEDRSLNRSQGGLGIGHTVVRSMVELHGGKVEVHSGGLGQGSEFVVTLPRIAHVARSVATTREDVAPVPARILVVDDNADAGVMLATLLRLSGHQVEVALDGPAALELFERQRPQIVLCDIGLPGMNGYEVAERMRVQDNGPKPVMIALTGYDGPEHRVRALEVGFDHHLAKPVDFEALRDLIDVCAAKGLIN
jgi:CheY-like chemotaxis protein/two-component sensor histidine kinase